MADATYLPTSPPDDIAKDKVEEALRDGYATMYQEVENHFTKEGYDLPGAAENDKALNEREKFWLSHECILR